MAAILLNFPPDPYVGDSVGLKQMDSVRALGAKLGATAYRAQVSQLWIPERMDRWAKALVASKSTLYVDLNWKPRNQDAIAAYPAPEWAHYNWPDGHVSRPPVKAAVASVASQAQSGFYLANKVISLGGTRDQVKFVLDNEPCRAVLDSNGIWKADWQSPWLFDDEYKTLVRETVPVVKSILSGWKIAGPTMSGKYADRQAAEYLAIGVPALDAMGLNRYPYMPGYPTMGGDWLTGYKAIFYQGVEDMRAATGLPVWNMETAPIGRDAPFTEDQYVQHLQEIVAFGKSLTNLEVVGWYKPVATNGATSPSQRNDYGPIRSDGTLSPALSALLAA